MAIAGDTEYPGPLPSSVPVFLAQGAADELVRPAVTENYMTDLCRAGSKVPMMLLPGVGHLLVGRDSADAAVQWRADRFANLSPPSDCATKR
jgi:predicted esterase